LNAAVTPGLTPLLPARVSDRIPGYQVAPGQNQQNSSAILASGDRQAYERLRLTAFSSLIQ
jgi:hypothetical protein